jgi:hypothetical protein
MLQIVFMQLIRERRDILRANVEEAWGYLEEFLLFW